MAAHLEQHDVVELVVAAAACLPEIHQFVGILLVGEKTAAARRLRPIGEAKFPGKRHLRFAVTAVKTVQRFAIDPAFPFRQRRRQQFCAEWPQQAVVGA